MNSAAATAAVKFVGEARPPRVAKYGAKKESKLAVSRRTAEQLLNTNSERSFVNGLCVSLAAG